MGDLEGKVALVTGGAGGLGEAIVRTMAEAGAALVLTDIADERGRAIAADIAASGGRARYESCDIRNFESVRRTVAAAAGHFGGIDILVNTAGVSPRSAPITEVTEKEWLDLMDVNVNAVFRFCSATLPHIVARGGGSVINLSSVHHAQSFPNASAYAASKGAVVSLSRQLAVEWGPANVRVNTVSPGAIDSGMTRRTLAEDPSGKLAIAYGRLHALERMGRPIEVAKTVTFLASDGAGFITGEDILVDGGWTKTSRWVEA